MKTLLAVCANTQSQLANFKLSPSAQNNLNEKPTEKPTDKPTDKPTEKPN